jgi:hypothetical protein
MCLPSGPCPPCWPPASGQCSRSSVETGFAPAPSHSRQRDSERAHSPFACTLPFRCRRVAPSPSPSSTFRNGRRSAVDSPRTCTLPHPDGHSSTPPRRAARGSPDDERWLASTSRRFPPRRIPGLPIRGSAGHGPVSAEADGSCKTESSQSGRRRAQAGRGGNRSVGVSRTASIPRNRRRRRERSFGHS